MPTSRIRFVCTECHGDLQTVGDRTVCVKCSTSYARLNNTFVDFAPETTFDDHWARNPERMREWLEIEAAREEEYETQLSTRYVKPMLGRLLGLHPGQCAVLSAGCGMGSDVDMLIADGYDTWGIDIGNRVMCWANRQHPERLARGDIRKMPLPEDDRRRNNRSTG